MPEGIGKRQRGQDSALSRDENEPPAKRPREMHSGREPRRSNRDRESASPDRTHRRRDRSRSRDRQRDDRRDRRRDRDGETRGYRSRSRDGHRARRDSPRRRPRSRSRSPQRSNRRSHRSPRPSATEPRRQDPRADAGLHNDGQKMDLSGPSAAAVGEGGDAETAMMMRMMGFAGFRSTKNTKVPGNNVGAVRKDKQTTYRQYMNRVGGFNRPLSPSR